MKIVADKVAFYTNVGFIVDYIKKFFAENGTPINVAPHFLQWLCKIYISTKWTEYVTKVLHCLEECMREGRRRIVKENSKEYYY